MGKITCYWKNSRPSVTINYVKSANLGRCYNSYTYQVTSTTKLGSAVIGNLWKSGLLGSGQTYRLKSTCDGSEEPAGYDIVPCKAYDEDTGEVVNETPVNYAGKPYDDSKQPYYQYVVETLCDSGD